MSPLDGSGWSMSSSSAKPVVLKMFRGLSSGGRRGGTRRDAGRPDERRALGRSDFASPQLGMGRTAPYGFDSSTQSAQIWSRITHNASPRCSCPVPDKSKLLPATLSVKLITTCGPLLRSVKAFLPGSLPEADHAHGLLRYSRENDQHSLARAHFEVCGGFLLSAVFFFLFPARFSDSCVCFSQSYPHRSLRLMHHCTNRSSPRSVSPTPQRRPLPGDKTAGFDDAGLQEFRMRAGALTSIKQFAVPWRVYLSNMSGPDPKSCA